MGERASGTTEDKTKSGERCRWCGTVFLTRSGPGRPRVYCSHSCRQQHYVERRTAIGDGRDPDRVVIERSAYDLFESRRLQLQLAIDDVSRSKVESDAMRPELYQWVLEYAQALVDVDLVNPSQ